MTPTGRRSGRRDWLLCGVDIAAVLALLALSSRTGDPWWGLLAVGWGAVTARQLRLAIRSHTVPDTPEPPSTD
jgi:hypothetical protein